MLSNIIYSKIIWRKTTNQNQQTCLQQQSPQPSIWSKQITSTKTPVNLCPNNGTQRGLIAPAARLASLRPTQSVGLLHRGSCRCDRIGPAATSVVQPKRKVGRGSYKLVVVLVINIIVIRHHHQQQQQHHHHHHYAWTKYTALSSNNRMHLLNITKTPLPFSGPTVSLQDTVHRFQPHYGAEVWFHVRISPKGGAKQSNPIQQLFFSKHLHTWNN